MEVPQAGNQELVRYQSSARNRFDKEKSREWASEQERELAQKLRKVLQENRIYGDEQLRHTMAVLRKLGVKDTQHFSYITAEDLLREGMPLVTARILMRTYEASGNQSKWERFLVKIWQFLNSPAGRLLLCVGEIAVRIFLRKHLF